MVVTLEHPASRLDHFLAQHFSQHSRAFWQRLITQGHVRLNQRPALPKSKLRQGDMVHIEIPPPQPQLLPPAYVPFGVLYEDKHLLVVNKPQGLCVHPAATTTGVTLVQGLLHHCLNSTGLSGIGGVLRPGIVHRLDKGTSGCLVVAKDDATHVALQTAFAKRQVAKTYVALVYGKPQVATGLWDTPYGRHKIHRLKFTCKYGDKQAITRYHLLASRFGLSVLKLELHTGRTHQLRVHLSEAGLPIVGDPLYGKPGKLQNVPPEAMALIAGQQYQMLHAALLHFVHPWRKTELRIEAPLPNAMQQLTDIVGG